MCSRLLNDKECEVFDNLHILQASVKEETLLPLIHRVSQKNDTICDPNDTKWCHFFWGHSVLAGYAQKRVV